MAWGIPAFSVELVAAPCVLEAPVAVLPVPVVALFIAEPVEAAAPVFIAPVDDAVGAAVGASDGEGTSLVPVLNPSVRKPYGTVVVMAKSRPLPCCEKEHVKLAVLVKLQSFSNVLVG